jgi:quercetin dioxygenase-like cupin family protein
VAASDYGSETGDVTDHGTLTLPILRQPGDRETLTWLGGAQVQILMDTAATAGRMSVLTIAADEGYTAAAHVHSREDELFYVLRGAMTAWVGDRRLEVATGASVLLPRGVGHRYRVDADGTELLNVCTPGGLDGFFREIAAELAAAHAVPEADLSATITRTAARYGLSYLTAVRRPLDAGASGADTR